MQTIKLHPFRVFTTLGITFLLTVAANSFINFSFDRLKYVLALIIVLLLFAALANFILKNRLLTLLSWVLIVVASTTLFYIYVDHLFNVSLEQKEYNFQGIVVNNPEYSDKNQKIEVKTKLNDQSLKILVFAPKYPSLNYGDQVAVQGVLEIPKNFSDFNYQNYLKPKHIKYIISKPDSVTDVGDDERLSIRLVGSLYSFSNKMKLSLKRVLADPEAGLASGLIFGGKESLPEDFNNNLKATGLTHIVALSGYNVTIIFEIIALLLINYLGRKKSFIISLSLLIFFILMTGASSSVMRAAVFIVVMNVARLVGRRADRLNILIFTALVMSLWNPFMLVFDLSFQLSFLAFIGILYFTPYVENILYPLFREHLPAVRIILTETLSAQLAVLPLLVLVFGYFSVISPITNVLVLWIIPLAMLVSLITALLSFLLPSIAFVSTVISWPVLKYIVGIVNYFSQFPFAQITVSKAYAPIIIVFYLGCWAYFHFGKKLKTHQYELVLERGRL